MGFQEAEKELTALPVLSYGSGHKKGGLKILSFEGKREKNMRSLTNARLIAALTVGTVVLLAAPPPSAQDRETGNRAPFWPGTKGPPVVKEWYTDIPWHQKLGTFAGNEIDEALILPYEALGDQEKTF